MFMWVTIDKVAVTTLYITYLLPNLAVPAFSTFLAEFT